MTPIRPTRRVGHAWFDVEAAIAKKRVRLDASCTTILRGPPIIRRVAGVGVPR